MPAKKTSSQAAKPKASRPHAPGYGLPTGNKGLLPWSWAEQRLQKSHNYWITTVKPVGSPQGVSPHTMVVWGLWQDGRFLFSTGSKSRKARNLAQNPKLRSVYGTCARSGHCGRRRRNCRCRGATQIPSRLRAKIQVRHAGYEARHPLDEGASLRGSSAGCVWFVGEGVRRQIHALEVCLEVLASPRLVISVTASLAACRYPRGSTVCFLPARRGRPWPSQIPLLAMSSGTTPLNN